MRRLYASFYIFFLLLAPLLCLGQLKHTPLQDGPDVKVKKKAPDQEMHLDFPNLNKVAYYKDSKKLSEIQRLERRKQYAQALPLLERYVRNFGIQNFYKDTSLLWRLGQLYERQGMMNQAMEVYRLVLKHHRSDIRQVQSYYDSLEQNTKDYYVPLSYYYELVEYRKTISSYQPPRGVYLNMGNGINSPYEDYGPTLSGDNNTLIFTSKRTFLGIESKPNEDLYYAQNNNEFWSEAQSFGKPINSIYNEGSATLSRDGKTLYFARCESPDGYGNCDIYKASLQPDGTWHEIENLGPNVNGPAWDSQPTLSPNEDTLYFASDRLGGFGLSDIYFTYKTSNGGWAPAQNMGPIINTRQSEVSPFYHPKYKVLYFSSRGQLFNFGDFDIYKTYLVGGRWQEPRNIGPLVNGRGSEYYFTIDSQSKNLYYARSEESDIKNLDLFSFPLPMEAHPLAVTKVEGVLRDSVSNKPLTGIISIIDLDNGIEISSKYIRPDGSFAFHLIDNSRYMMIIQSPDFFTIERELALQQDTSLQIMTKVIDHNIPIVFRNIEFDPNESNITEDMHAVLDEVAYFLAENPGFRLEISGHTDSAGDPEFNQILSKDRADAILQYIQHKVRMEDGRIEAYGYGSSKPLREEKTEEDRRINRRVEFRLIKPVVQGRGIGK